MARAATWPATLTPRRIPPRWSIPLFIALTGRHRSGRRLCHGLHRTAGCGADVPDDARFSGEIRSTISATGPITNPASLPLTFKSSGKLVDLRVQVGDRVTAGQVLAQLDASDLEANLAQAQSQLIQAQANYDKLAAGPTEEAINVARAQVAAAEQSLPRLSEVLA